MSEPTTTAATGVRDRLVEYLREQSLRLTEHFAAAVVDGDATAIHKSRVALRRTRSALRQFAPLLPRRRRRRATRTVRVLARALGAIRDLDALSARLDAEALAPLREPAETLSRLRTALQAERERELAALPGVATPALLGRVLVRVAAAAAASEDAGAVACLQRVTTRFLDAVAPLVPRAQDPEQIGSQHQIRIQVKRVRYACELLDPLVPGGLAEEIGLAQAAQEGLGLLQDLAVLADLLPRLVPQSEALLAQLVALRRAEHARLLTADPELISALCRTLRSRSVPESVA